ncbi:hypothetical protein NE865_16462 [Phthorimaea operculella]|nr:hypothetical protein NE865_16462 [Phthorimaea operculella]
MFVFKSLVFTVLVCAYAQGQQAPPTTPVPILKQINKQNDDGSYSYGYEAADGSFKIETKYPNGDVAGKYGYVDESGKLREISYGASSKRGFEPQGAGIVVPPPHENEPTPNALADGQEDDGQYREDPKIYEDPKYNGRQSSRPAATFRQYHRDVPAAPVQQEPQYQQTQYQQPAYQPQQPAYQPQQPAYQPQPSHQAPQQFSQDLNRPQSQVYHSQPQFSFQSYTPQYSQPQYQQPQQYQYDPNRNYNPFTGHPAQNFDPNTGSYTINFTG